MTVLTNAWAKVCFGACMALLALLMPFAASAQEPQAPQRVSPTTEIPKLYTFHAESRQIIVAASTYYHVVGDWADSIWEGSADPQPNGEAWAVKQLNLKFPVARGLSAKDFHILDNGVEQSINYFKESDFSAVDISGQWLFIPTKGGIWGFPIIRALQAPEVTYLIGYVPPALNPGECHTVQAVVQGLYVYLNRNQYCNRGNSEGTDVATLEGTPLGARMRTFADSAAQGSIKAATQAFAFWSSGVLSLVRETSPTGNGAALPKADFTYVVEVHDSKAPATVHIATQFARPKEMWNCFKADRGAAIQVLGIVYKSGGQVAGQFADTYACGDAPLGPGLPRGWWHGLRSVPNRFDTQIELTPGDYELVVVLSDGKNFGRVRVPLHVEPFDGQRLMISDVVFGGVVRGASWVAEEAALVSPAPIVPSPLVSNKVQFFPATNTRFQKSDHLPLYFEIYEPQPAGQNIGVSFTLRVTDLKAGSVVEDMERINAADWIQPGHAVIPVGMKLRTAKLKKGSYRLEVQASDSAGRVSERREATFTLE
jgi:hypothetical protein